jgi:hypothetical protein
MTQSVSVYKKRLIRYNTSILGKILEAQWWFFLPKKRISQCPTTLVKILKLRNIKKKLFFVQCKDVMCLKRSHRVDYKPRANRSSQKELVSLICTYQKV